jgi:HEAT repeat protein
MYTIKTVALAFIALVASLMLLLGPNTYRDEAPTGDASSAKQNLHAGIRQQTAFRFEHAQPATPESDDALPITQKKSKPEATSSTITPSVDWPLILYPELARIAELENQSVDTALGELLPMLSNDDPVIRLAAIESLGDIDNQATLPALAAALNDPNPQLRIAALEALASQEDESVVTSIEPYLFDSDRIVRVAAIEALAELESTTALHALAGLLSDPDSLIRHHAVNALGEIGGENAMLYLLQARYDSNENIRANAEAILAELEYSAAY